MIPTQREYEEREAADLRRKLTEIERAPLAERREAAAAYTEALSQYPEVVAERVEWLINGSYGYGAHAAARRILADTHSNRAAQLGQLTAALEWLCPNARARTAYNGLTAEQQTDINNKIEAVIAEAEAEKRAEEAEAALAAAAKPTPDEEPEE